MSVPARDARWIPATFAAAFLVVVAANAALVTIALGTWSGLATDRPFDRGVAYNDTLRKVREEAALGWRAALTASGTAEAARLDMSLFGSDGQPLTVAGEAVADLRRPTRSGMDLKVTLVAVGPGRYRAEFALPAPGVWDAQVTFVHARGRFHAAERLVIRP